MDEKKANLYHNGLTIQLHDHLVLSPNLSYNDLASAVIDQERMMKAVDEANEKKRKRKALGSSISGDSSGAPLLINDNNSSTHNPNSSSFSCIIIINNNNSSTLLLLHRHSRLPLGHQNSFPPATFHASTVGRWGTSLMKAASPNRATHHEL
jgi:hypothetical protein